MDYITFLLLLPLLWAFAHVLNFSPFPQKYSAKARLPPGPRPLPIVGNLFKLRDQPHKSLADLSKIYGPIMFLKLGSIPTIIISSSKTAQQVLQKNDQPLSNRVVPDAVRALDHHQNSMVCANTVFSTDLVHHDSKFSQEIKDIVWGVMEEIGRLNVADYFPVFRLLDPQGIRRAMKIYFSKLSDIFYGIIDQRLKSEASSVASNDVLDALLNLTKEDNHEWSFSDTIHLLLDTFLAGTDTTSSTVEWAMAELISNPKTMAKLEGSSKKSLARMG
ncbi:hypothetical protein VitviT2T_023570 [Vitis vinifera]|uniref:Geraniol 8-hydroxylase n=1 Tax=Vitis vinifera TaxID=29760 RepID=A0ABY9DGA3_VITVI|nr:hypothetical protein VitviT2T_023570 [Vitis vinifera]